MRRRARVTIAARRPVDSIIQNLSFNSATSWPDNFKRALSVLRREMALSQESSISLLIASVRSAHACARQINRRVSNLAEFQTRLRLARAFHRISNCLMRAPADLRRRLDTRLAPLVEQPVVDLEVIEEIFDVTVLTFDEFPKAEVSGTALRVMCDDRPGRARAITMKTDFSAVGSAYIRESERAILGLRKRPLKSGVGVAVFEALERPLDSGQGAKIKSTIHDVIDQYVAAVAETWRKAGLRPGRARSDYDATYRSKFHRFAELILSGIMQESSRANRKRPLVNGELINEHHIRRALRHSSKIGP